MTDEHSPSDRPQTGQTARRALLALFGLGAAAAGAWLSWRKPLPLQPTESPPKSTSPSSDEVPASFWQQQFDTPTGGQLTMASFKGRPLLINFWATWCPPCVKEMPELDKFSREFAPKGWKVIGLAIDSPTPVKTFLAKVGVGFDIGLAGMAGTELTQTLGNDAGGLPFSVMIDAQGRIQHRKLGGTDYKELAAWANAAAPVDPAQRTSP
ncbi:MAG: TlpA disulfide reductase family protein [Aquabacterium sp.]|nr:TlpA disulfide reductase family protein [Aquabacterium sp.]